jgi:riboflavin kinase/FMN adenylyltransferase
MTETLRGMRVYRDPGEVPPAEGRVVTIGAFDGVHLGHRAVLRLVRELASARTLAATILTFDRHPAEVVRPEHAPPLLTTTAQKLVLLAQTGAVDECLVLRFDEARSRESAEDFVETVLVGSLGARLVVVGSDFHFGYRRRGDVALLERMGADLGFEVLGLGLVATPDGRAASDGSPPYSSTRVREVLRAGDVEEAAAILGRPHEVEGVLDAAAAVVAVDARLCVPAPGRYRGEIVPAPSATTGGAGEGIFAATGVDAVAGGGAGAVAGGAADAVATGGAATIRFEAVSAGGEAHRLLVAPGPAVRLPPPGPVLVRFLAPAL